MRYLFSLFFELSLVAKFCVVQPYFVSGKSPRLLWERSKGQKELSCRCWEPGIRQESGQWLSADPNTHTASDAWTVLLTRQSPGTLGSVASASGTP